MWRTAAAELVNSDLSAAAEEKNWPRPEPGLAARGGGVSRHRPRTTPRQHPQSAPLPKAVGHPETVPSRRGWCHGAGWRGRRGEPRHLNTTSTGVRGFTSSGRGRVRSDAVKCGGEYGARSAA